MCWFRLVHVSCVQPIYSHQHEQIVFTMSAKMHIIISYIVYRSAAAYSDQIFPWTICRSVRRSVCPLHCGKTANRIRMPFGIIGRTGTGMRQVVHGFGDRSTGRGSFAGEFGARHCNQWELYGVHVRQRRDATLFPNYFGQTC